MNPSQLFSEVARQNKLLKETIDSFQFTLSDTEEPESPLNATDREEEDLISNLSYIPSSSPTLSSSSSSSSTLSSTSSTLTTHSIQQIRIETLIDLLNKQESRLDLLEGFGNEVLLNTALPIYRGSNHPNEISIQEWCRIISNRLNSLKPINKFNNTFNSKSVLILIYNHLDLKPLKLLINLLERNKTLTESKFPEQIPPKFRIPSSTASSGFQEDLKFEWLDLLDYPLRLHVLRHPRALLNLLQSKFTEMDQRPRSLKDLNRIEIKPGDSLLLR